MKKIITLLFIVLFASINLHARIYAVIVGVEKYDGTVSDLTASVDDAERVYQFFLSFTPSENIVLLRDKTATKQNILHAMETLFKKASEDDMVVFYFSGHGAPGMFCPHNIKGGRMGLWHTEIKHYFKQSKAKTKLCIADACYAGSIRGHSNAAAQATSHSTPAGDNVIIFMSSRDNEVSIENPYQFSGIFTKHLLLGMLGNADNNNDGVVNAYELYAYVRRNVREDTKGKQTPVMFGNYQKYTPLIKYR